MMMMIADADDFNPLKFYILVTCSTAVASLYCRLEWKTARALISQKSSIVRARTGLECT